MLISSVHPRVLSSLNPPPSPSPASACSKMLISSVDLGCSEEVLTIIGMLSAQNIFYRWVGDRVRG